MGVPGGLKSAILSFHFSFIPFFSSQVPPHQHKLKILQTISDLPSSASRCNDFRSRFFQKNVHEFGGKAQQLCSLGNFQNFCEFFLEIPKSGMSLWTEIGSVRRLTYFSRRECSFGCDFWWLGTFLQRFNPERRGEFLFLKTQRLSEISDKILPFCQSYVC